MTDRFMASAILVENFFAKIKQFRAIATRYEKTARNFLAAVQLVASVVWLNYRLRAQPEVPGWESLDANRMPYFVLPLPKSWPPQFGISLGDYAAVLFKGQ